jgi:hypothetical protein
VWCSDLPQSQAQQPESPTPREQCLKDNYGDIYDKAFALSAIGLGKALMQGGQMVVNHAIEQDVTRIANRDLYSPNYYRGKGAMQALQVFKFANVAADVLAVGTTFFVVGAEGYCLLMK